MNAGCADPSGTHPIPPLVSWPTHTFHSSRQLLAVCFEFHHLQLNLPGPVNEVGFQGGETENRDLLHTDDAEPLKSQREVTLTY